MKRAIIFCAVLTLGGFWSCSGDDDQPHTGHACAAPGDCYPNVKGIKGDIMCLTRVEGGYCTHLCQTSNDCCAADGECKGLTEICGPFESTGQRMCFLSCETAVVGGKDPTVYCQENAHKSFICRSTGGGSTNVKVCVPGG